MVCQTKTKAANDSPAVKQINVTDLTQSQRRILFADCLNQAGFTGFSKTRNGKQTFFTFTYHNEN